MRRALYTIAACLALTSVAMAQDAEEGLARSYYKLGKQLYDRADYSGALEQFKRAYQHAPRPALLFNIGRCHESMGELEQAIGNYRQYSATQPADLEQVQARIENLERIQLRRQKQRRIQAAASSQPAPSPGAPSLAPRAGASTRSTKVDAATSRASSSATDESRFGRLAGWVLAGSGAALLVTGVVFGALAKSRATELEDANVSGRDEYADHSDVEDEGRAFEAAQIATLTIGAAAALGGAVLLYLDYAGRDSRATKAAWLLPSVAPGGAGLHAGLSF